MYIFDLDGTLLDSIHLWHDIDLEFLKMHNKAWTEEFDNGVVNATFYQAAEFARDYCGISDTPEDIMQFWTDMAYEKYSNVIQLKPNAREFLDYCYQLNVEMALFTSCMPKLGNAALKHHNLNKYFKHKIFTNELNLEKHSVKTCIKISEMLNVNPNDCILFDDSPLNCAAAKNAGWHVVGVFDEHISKNVDTLGKFSDRVIRNFSELINNEFF